MLKKHASIQLNCDTLKQLNNLKNKFMYMYLKFFKYNKQLLYVFLKRLQW